MAGQLWGWGINNTGQLGDNTIIKKSSPVQTVAFGTNWISYSSYYHSAGIKTDGTLWLWGSNSYGQLGTNSNTNTSSPVQTIALGNNWTQVSCSGQHSAAIKSDGTLWLWGSNQNGKLGTNSNTNTSSPVQTIALGNNWTQVSCGYAFTAAIKNDNSLWLWGENSNGNLGDNTRSNKSSPVQTIAGGNNWVQVSCGLYHVAAIKSDGTIWCWGNNYAGTLGDNTTSNKSSPVQVFGYGTNWKQASCGWFGTSAIKEDGSLWNWGYNAYGQIGDNTVINKSSPVQTNTFATNWSFISCSNYSKFATKTDGTLWGWGKNNNGQLGNNSTTNRSSPVQTIVGNNRWKLFNVGEEASFAIYENDANQLGIKTQPLSAFNGTKLLVQPEININDSAGSVVRIASNTVTVSVFSGTATLSGTTTVTAVDGVATFTDLVLSGYGPVVLQFTSSGLTAASSTTFTVDLPSSVVPKRSENSGSIPTSGQLNIGELAINIEDKKGYVKKSDGTILNIFNGEIADGGTF